VRRAQRAESLARNNRIAIQPGRREELQLGERPIRSFSCVIAQFRGLLDGFTDLLSSGVGLEPHLEEPKLVDSGATMNLFRVLYRLFESVLASIIAGNVSLKDADTMEAANIIVASLGAQKYSRMDLTRPLIFHTISIQLPTEYKMPLS
jgi:hypothetical protein